MPALLLESLRPYATYGARSLLKAGLGLTPDDPDYDAQRKRFLAIYDRRKLDHTHLFDGVLELLIALERRGLIWGIVTNKNSRLAEPMIHELLRARSRQPAVVCGDSTPTRSHPAPLLLAARDAEIEATDCWFVGDGENMRASPRRWHEACSCYHGYVPDIGTPAVGRASRDWQTA